MKSDRTQIKEEHSIQLAHQESYQVFNSHMNQIWMDAVCGGQRAQAPEGSGFAGDYQDLLQTISKDEELLKLYVASGITLAADFARKQGVPREQAEDAKRKSFLQLAHAENAAQMSGIGAELLKELRRSYQRYCMKGYSPLITRAVEEIHLRRYEPISPGQVAQLLHADASYLSRSFHRETGYTLTSYINRVKIDTAADLIREHVYSLLEISELLGYRSYAYFSRVFKKETGVSPNEWEASEHEMTGREAREEACCMGGCRNKKIKDETKK